MEIVELSYAMYIEINKHSGNIAQAFSRIVENYQNESKTR